MGTSDCSEHSLTVCGNTLQLLDVFVTLLQPSHSFFSASTSLRLGFELKAWLVLGKHSFTKQIALTFFDFPLRWIFTGFLR